MKAFENKTTGIIGSLELKKTRYKVMYWCIFAVLVIISLISIIPSIWVLLSGFKSVKEIYQIPPDIFPKEIRLSKLYEVWKLLKLGNSYIASTIICLGELFFGILFPALGGYVISRLRPRGSKLVMSLLLWTMMMPGSIRTVPLFMIFNDLPLIHISLIGTYFPMWLGAGANIFTTLLFKNNFDAISISLIEAARIDGCSDFKTFKDILLPLSTPIIMVAAIRIIVASWSNFLWPMLVIKDENYMPVTVKLYRMKTQYQLDQYMLALIFGMIPPALMYVIFQKYILGGQNIGGVKE